MKRIVFGLCLAALVSGVESEARAQNNQQHMDLALAEVSPTPTEDMWFYLQEMRRYDDAQQMIRRKAEQKAAQRRLRIATMKWFGFSASRPVANPTPWTGVAAPSWVGNGVNPNYWVGGGYVTSALAPIELKKR